MATLLLVYFANLKRFKFIPHEKISITLKNECIFKLPLVNLRP